ncbi:MAG: MFS transporter [Candidatus Aenigmarchaeota archaeon]|nr:MFS transporter [Candidatus Aenigmarchaeota archaeon]
MIEGKERWYVRLHEQPRRPAGETGSEDRNLKNYDRQGAFSTAGTQIVNTYATPLALSYRASHYEIGLLSSLISFASMIALIPGAKMIERIGSRKTVWVAASLLSRLFWIPLAALPFFIPQGPSTFAVYVIIASLAASSFCLGFRWPAQSSMMADAVPRATRGRYFGKRNMIMGVSGLVSLLVAGQVLLVYGFGALFLVAVAVGMVSTFFIALIFETPFRSAFFYRRTFNLGIRDLPRSLAVNRNFFLFTVFILLFHFSVRITSPFFTVFMLEDLAIGYFWFAIAAVLRSGVEIFSHPYWGRLADRIGEKHMIRISSILIVVIPLAWVFAANPLEAVVIEMLSGFAWSAFDLSSFTMLIGVTPDRQRPRFLAIHNTLKELALLTGALVGGVLAQSFQGSTFLWFAGLQLLFLVGFVLRAGVLVLVPLLRDPRISRSGNGLFWEVVVFAPSRGVFNQSWRVVRVFKEKKVNRVISGAITKVNDKRRLRMC